MVLTEPEEAKDNVPVEVLLKEIENILTKAATNV
jgi:hypothetical protein